MELNQANFLSDNDTAYRELLFSQKQQVPGSLSLSCNVTEHWKKNTFRKADKLLINTTFQKNGLILFNYNFVLQAIAIVLWRVAATAK